MDASQQLVVHWMEFAFVGAVVLGVTTLVVDRIRQPIDRVNLIVMSILASVLVPLVLFSLNTPSLRLGLISIEGSQLGLVDATALIGEQMHSKSNLSASPLEQMTDKESRDSKVIIPSQATKAFDGTREFGVPSQPSESVERGLVEGSAIWSVIAAILLASHGMVAFWWIFQWIVGTIRLRTVSKRSIAADKSILDLWSEVSGCHGRSVRLLVSDEIRTPMFFGFWKHVILLPASIVAGDPSSLRFCLDHEWSHLRGRDLMKWHLVNLCQLVLWCQPLFWRLRRELRLCQDLVADDHATKSVTNQLARVEYSELLLSIAKETIKPTLAGGMAFYDRSSHLARRIKMLLSNRHPLRNQSTRAFCWFSGLALLLLAIAISSVRLSTVQAQVFVSEKPIDVNVDESGSSANAQVKEANIKTVRGQVVDSTGAPVANAKLCLPLQWHPRRTIEAATDATGRFELICPADWISPKVSGSFCTLWAYAPGYSIQSQSVHGVVRGESVEEYTIQLPSESNTRFRVLAPNGQPLIGVEVQPQNYKTSVAYEAVPEELLNGLVGRTDEDGFVKLPAIQLAPLFSLEMRHKEYGRQSVRIDNSQTSEYREIRLRDVASIKGRLISENPEWVRKVKLSFATDNQERSKEPQGIAEVVTDDEGNFQVTAIASGGPLRTHAAIDPALPVRPVYREGLFLTVGETVDLEIPLVDAPLVRGKVVAKSTGKPIANAEMYLDYGGLLQSDRVVTNDRGEYQGHVLPGKVRVYPISLPSGFVQLGTPWSEPYDVPANVDRFDLPTIEVVGSRDVEGVLVGENDQPLPKVQVMAVKGKRRYGFGISDSKGRFSIRVPDGVVTEINVLTQNQGFSPVQVVSQDPLVVKLITDRGEYK